MFELLDGDPRRAPHRSRVPVLISTAAHAVVMGIVPASARGPPEPRVEGGVSTHHLQGGGDLRAAVERLDRCPLNDPKLIPETFTIDAGRNAPSALIAAERPLLVVVGDDCKRGRAILPERGCVMMAAILSSASHQESPG